MSGWSSEIGGDGERIAVGYLRDAGFEIIERNWRRGRLEIDIIARRHDELHFVEVKTRSITDWTTPEEALDRRKRTALRRAAAGYLACSGSDLDPRFDLVAVDRYPDGRVEVRFTADAIEAHW